MADDRINEMSGNTTNGSRELLEIIYTFNGKIADYNVRKYFHLIILNESLLNESFLDASYIKTA